MVVKRDNALPLEKCVVDVACPALTGAQLLGIPEMTELGDITGLHAAGLHLAQQQ